MAFPKPKLNHFGASFGKYGGDVLTDYSPEGDIDPSKLNSVTMSDGVEFTKFDETVKDYLLGMLGHPVVRVELTPFQIKHCIDEGVNKLNYHAPLWTLQYAAFDASSGQNIYELPAYIIQNLSYVVYKKSLLSIQAQAGTLEFDYFLKYFQDNFLFENAGVADFYLLQQNLEMVRKVLSQEGTWNVINSKYIQLSPAPATTPVPVILEYRALDSNTIHPAYRSWIQRYALAVSKGVLGQIRGKFEAVPGPGGGSRLNGAALLQESAVEKEALMKELLSEIEEPPVFTAF